MDYKHYETARHHIIFRTYFTINPGQEKSHVEKSERGTRSNSPQAQCRLHEKHKALLKMCASFQDSSTASVKSSHLENSTKLLNNIHHSNTHDSHHHHHCLHHNVSLSWRCLMVEPSFVEIFQNNSCHWIEAGWHGAMIQQQNSGVCSIFTRNDWTKSSN